MKQRLIKAWRAFANVAIVFSFVVNLVLILVLLLAVGPLFQLKTGLVEPLLSDLDQAFLGLGETDIETKVQVNQPIGICFDMPLDEPLDLNFDLPINEETVVVLTEPVPLNNMPARFSLPGGGGAINGSVSLSLPAGMRLPVQLDMEVPVVQTIPVRMTIPVSETVPVEMNIPVNIQLGEAGLDPAVQELREVFSPLREFLERLPDGFEFRR